MFAWFSFRIKTLPINNPRSKHSFSLSVQNCVCKPRVESTSRSTWGLLKFAYFCCKDQVVTARASRAAITWSNTRSRYLSLTLQPVYCLHCLSIPISVTIKTLYNKVYMYMLPFNVISFQAFFAVYLHDPRTVDTLPPIQDPDPLINCEIMDGRDNFLTQAKELRLEFRLFSLSTWWIKLHLSSVSLRGLLLLFTF